MARLSHKAAQKIKSKSTDGSLYYFSSAPKLAHGLAHFPFGLFIALGLAAVPLLFTLGERQFAFGDAFAKVNPQGDDG
jgi:hypothetical protein